MRTAILTALLAASLHAAVTADPPGCANSAGTISVHPCTVTLTVAGAVSDSTENTELNNAWRSGERGDTIKHTAGHVWRITSDSNYPTINKDPAGASGCLTLTTTEVAKLPADGTQITRAYIPVVPIIEGQHSVPVFAIGGSNVCVRGINVRVASNATQEHTGGLILVGSNQSAFTSATVFKEAGHYPLTTLTATPTIDGSNKTIAVVDGTAVTAGQKVIVGTAYNGVQQVFTVDSTTANSITFVEVISASLTSGMRVTKLIDDGAKQPTNITLQHIIIDNPNFKPFRCGINLAAQTATVKDSHIEFAFSIGNTDTQGICGVNGPGPFTITNNTVLNTSENIMFGGSTPSWDGQPNSYTLRYNRLAKYRERDYISAYRTSETVWKGLFTYGSDQGYAGGYFVALNTGTSCATEPAWDRTTASFTSGSVTTDCGNVQWRYMGNVRQIPKNLLEMKSGQNGVIEYNGFQGWWLMLAINTNQRSAINIKAENQPQNQSTGWPTNYNARTTAVAVRNNHVEIDEGSVAQFVGGTAGAPAAFGGHTFQGNLAEIGTPNDLTLYVNLTAGTTQWSDPTFNFIGNTFYSPNSSSATNAYNVHSESSAAFIGTGVLKGNIFPKQNSSTHKLGGTGDTATDFEYLYGCNPCTSSQIERNVTMGANTANYPANGAWNGCPSGAACPQDWDNTQGSVALFRNRTQRDFRVKHGHTFARGTYNGADVGADPSQVPDIRGLSVSTTDRTVLFQYSVTPVIRTIPCVVEVSTEPDFTAYAGELSTANIWTYYQQDSDAHDKWPRSSGMIRRTVAIGHTANLTAATTYYYRLSCGGWSRRGSFVTAAAKTSTTTLSVSRASLAAATWGYAYSRATDSITDSAAMSCASNTCTATATRGRLVYWRAGSGPVQAVQVQ